MNRSSPFIAFAITLTAFNAASAQVITGRSLDAQTRDTIPFVQLRLITPQGDTIRRDTDANGIYLISAPGPGRYKLIASRIGYSDITTPAFELRGNEVLRLDVRLTPQGIKLDSLVVVGRSGIEPGRFGFDRRCANTSGICLNQDSIRRRNAASVANLFQGIEDVSVRGQVVEALRGYGCLAVFMNNRTQPIHTSNRWGRMTDNLPMPSILPKRGSTATPEWSGLSPVDVIGIEIYRGIEEVPKELLAGTRIPSIWPSGSPQPPCGVAIVWTRAAW